MNVRRVLSLAAALTAMSVSGMGAGVAGPAHAAEGTGQVPATSLAASGYRLVNNWTGKCVEVAGASTSVGAPVQQWDCGTASHRRWAPTDLGNGFFRLQNQRSFLCMSLVVGTLVVDQQICNDGDPRQWWQWQIADTYGNRVLVSAPGSACLALRPLSLKNGTAVGIEDCATTSAQLWHFAL